MSTHDDMTPEQRRVWNDERGRELRTLGHEACVEYGRKGGQATSAAKAAAARRNGAMPRRDGKKRGWPLGKKRKPLLTDPPPVQ